MKLSELKKILKELDEVNFSLSDGSKVPAHFHITEVGAITKKFIDCGGTLRNEERVNFQLWTSNDYDHRLSAQKLRNIIELSEEKLGIKDNVIEVEYQGHTIGKYDLDFVDGQFILQNQFTDCLAKDNCGIPQEKPRVRISTRPQEAESCCVPGSGCC
ncbi:DUF6428 family protein [Reichenbachiella versicolor]|uniref:DUF6428 family protein n=1 Tax=Reichenbachiella versicolor TaxID=1821036 RepID=UPI000D6E7B09|nr:DUF6428 family protein [Reichenbachiella versicolor]